MDPTTISTATFTLRQGTTPVAGTVSYTGVTGTFTPTANLAPLTTYTATISTGARDLAGNALSTDIIWSFTTGVIPDTTAPSVRATVPPNLATSLPTNAQISLNFTEAMDASTISTATFTLKQVFFFNDAATTEIYTLSLHDALPILAPLTTYTATISTGARDLAGNALTADISWSFTTGIIPDTTAP